MLHRRNYPTSTSASTTQHRRNNLQDDDTSSSEDEEEILRREQDEADEEERLLSEAHGEAMPGPTSINASRKRQSDAEIANVLNSNDPEVAKKKRSRKVLTEVKLTNGKNGLVKIRHEFPTKVKYHPPKPIKPNSRNGRITSSENEKIMRRKQLQGDFQASANYASKLIQHYQEFAVDMAPSVHPTDTFHKIQDLGKKKQVKEYLNMMRREVCKDFLVTLYGPEKAEKYMNELEHGLSGTAAAMALGGDDQGEGGNRIGDVDMEADFDNVGGIGVAQRLATLESEEGTGFQSRLFPSPSASPSDDVNDLLTQPNTLDRQREQNVPTDLDDDEIEASFDDIVPLKSKLTSEKGDCDGEEDNQSESKWHSSMRKKSSDTFGIDAEMMTQHESPLGTQEFGTNGNATRPQKEADTTNNGEDDERLDYIQECQTQSLSLLDTQEQAPQIDEVAIREMWKSQEQSGEKASKDSDAIMELSQTHESLVVDSTQPQSEEESEPGENGVSNHFGTTEVSRCDLDQIQEKEDISDVGNKFEEISQTQETLLFDMTQTQEDEEQIDKNVQDDTVMNNISPSENKADGGIPGSSQDY